LVGTCYLGSLRNWEKGFTSVTLVGTGVWLKEEGFLKRIGRPLLKLLKLVGLTSGENRF